MLAGLEFDPGRARGESSDAGGASEDWSGPIDPTCGPFRGSASPLSRQRRRSRRLQRIGHDLYAGRDRVRDRGLELDALLLVFPDSVVSHFSAALELGLTVDGDGHHHLTRTAGSSVSRRDGVVVHRGKLGAGDRLTSGHPRPVTGATRTYLDLARSLDLERLIILGDSILTRTDVTAADLAAAAAAYRGRGAVRARNAVPLLAPGARSAPETRIRLILHAAGFTGLRPGVVVRDEVGEWLAEPDLTDEDAKVAIQYDGETHFWLGDRARTIRQRRGDVARDELIRERGYEVLLVLGRDVDPAPCTDLAAHARLIRRAADAFARAAARQAGERLLERGA